MSQMVSSEWKIPWLQIQSPWVEIGRRGWGQGRVWWSWLCISLLNSVSSDLRLVYWNRPEKEYLYQENWQMLKLVMQLKKRFSPPQHVINLSIIYTQYQCHILIASWDIWGKMLSPASSFTPLIVLPVVRWLVAHCPVEVHTQCPTPSLSQQILEEALSIDGSFYSHKKPHDAMGLVTGPWLRSFGFSSATPADMLGDLKQANYFQPSRNINIHQNILEELQNKTCFIKQTV